MKALYSISPSKLRELRSIVRRFRIRCSFCGRIHTYNMLNDETKKALQDSQDSHDLPTFFREENISKRQFKKELRKWLDDSAED